MRESKMFSTSYSSFSSSASTFVVSCTSYSASSNIEI